MSTSHTKLHSSLHLLAALGALAAVAALPASALAAGPDTSEWKCESCPYPKGVSGSVDAGLGVVSDDSARFGDYTGLDRKGGFLVLDGNLAFRGNGGYWADLAASDLGLDSRSIAARSGREGLYTLRLGYSELARRYFDDAQTPFLGVGSTLLTLPAGFPAGSTAAMPLTGTLRPVDIGQDFKRFEVGGTMIGGPRWTWRVDLRRDTRDGTRPGYGSFFSTASQLPLPVDQHTDQLQVSASYTESRLQLSVGYLLSQFRNNAESLTWSNPFTPVVPGATQGQLALAPDNQFHQLWATAGYTILPTVRVSGDIAVGRMTQDSPFLASTLNPNLSVPVLPASSLDGRVNTYNGGVRLSAEPMPNLRVTASYSHDERDNRTASRTFPSVATDMFLDTTTRTTTPFSIKQDRVKVNAGWRGPDSLRVSGGIDYDQRERDYTEAVTTRETTVWGRVGLQPREDLSVAVKLAHAERTNSTYGIAIWFGAPENPLLRKYNLAARNRDSVGLRADLTVNEKVAVGLSADYGDDDYKSSVIGLQSARSVNVGADVSLALSEQTQIQAFAQSEQLRSRQAGSSSAGAPDWSARTRDRFEVIGLGAKHAAIPDKLDLGADITLTRARSTIAVDASVSDPPFPSARTTRDAVRLYATYRLNEQMSINGSWWYEHYDAQDWRLDGVAPATVGNLLAFGTQAPQYGVHVVRVALRYRF